MCLASSGPSTHIHKHTRALRRPVQCIQHPPLHIITTQRAASSLFIFFFLVVFFISRSRHEASQQLKANRFSGQEAFPQLATRALDVTQCDRLPGGGP